MQMTAMMVTVLAVAAAASSVESYEGCYDSHCPPGWVHFRNHCYKFVPPAEMELTFHQAEAHCQSFGGPFNATGHLASVLDWRENDFIFNMAVAAGKGGSFWIGLTDTKIEGSFEWTDGSRFNFSNWRNGSPDDGGPGRSEDQAEMSTAGEWNDTNGDSLTIFRGFMCKMPSFDKKKYVKTACTGKWPRVQ